jgi:copper transport protein
MTGLLAVLLGALLAGSAGAAAHAALAASEPAAGDTVTVFPPVLRLQFTEPVESEFARLALTSGDGRVIHLAPRRDPRDVYAIVADFPRLPPGGYLVSWRIVSADGHPVGGHFPFYAAVGPPGVPVHELLAGTFPAPDPPATDPTGMPAGMSGEPPVAAALLRAAAVSASLVLAGLLVLLMWGFSGRTGRLAALETRLAAITPLLLAGDFLLWLEHAVPAGELGVGAVAEALGTQNGAAYAIRVLLALLAAGALVLLRRPAVAAMFAVLAVVASGATGHPAAIQPAIAIPLKVIHLAGAGIWAAGLLVLLLSDREGNDYRAAALRVSGVALAAVLVIAATGLAEALLFLPSAGDLVRSTYGWLVLGKMSGLLLLVGFGAWHRFGLLPRLAVRGNSHPLRRSVAWETVAMAAVLVLAAFLGYMPPPTAGGPPASAAVQQP